MDVVIERANKLDEKILLDDNNFALNQSLKDLKNAILKLTEAIQR